MSSPALLEILASEAVTLAEAIRADRRRSPSQLILDSLVMDGSETLAKVAGAAVARLLASLKVPEMVGVKAGLHPGFHPSGFHFPHLHYSQFFTDAERSSLASALFVSQATADLLARWEVMERGEKVRVKEGKRRGKRQERRLSESGVPNKSGPGCHDPRTGHPAACGKSDGNESVAAQAAAPVQPVLSPPEREAVRALTTSYPFPAIFPYHLMPPGAGRADLIAKDPVLADWVRRQREHATVYNRAYVAHAIERILAKKPFKLPPPPAEITDPNRLKKFGKSASEIRNGASADLQTLHVFEKAIEDVVASHPLGQSLLEKARMEAKRREVEAMARENEYRVALGLRLREGKKRRARVLESVPNKRGPGCHDPRTGHPAPCPEISTHERPKTHAGLYHKSDDLHAAAADPEKAAQLYAQTHPKERKKFNALMDKLRTPAAAAPVSQRLAGPLLAAFPGATESAPGEYAVQLHGREIQIVADEGGDGRTGTVRIDFGNIAGDPQAVAGSLQRGSLELARALTAFAGQLAQAGLPISFSALETKRDAYARVLKRAGFEQESSAADSDIPGSVNEVWRPAAGVADGGAAVPSTPSTPSTPALPPRTEAAHLLIRQVTGQANLASLHKVREKLASAGIKTREEQDAAIIELQKQGKIGLSGPEGRHAISSEERAAWLKVGTQTFGHVYLREGRESEADDGLHREGVIVREPLSAATLLETGIHNKSGPGCHDPQTGHPADCGGAVTPPASRARAKRQSELEREVRSDIADDNRIHGYEKHTLSRPSGGVFDEPRRKEVDEAVASILSRFSPVVQSYFPRDGATVVHTDRGRTVWIAGMDGGNVEISLGGRNRSRLIAPGDSPEVITNKVRELIGAKGGVKESRQISHTLLEEVTPTNLPADAAVQFFKGLVPTLSKLPVALLPNYQRVAFSLAVATEQELLVKVQAVIAERLQSGEYSTGPKAVQAVLDAAGVSPRNPQYSAMVFRTNIQDARNAGIHAEMQEDSRTWVCWRYSNPDDSRSRPHHAALDGNYYPASVTMDAVRGASIDEKANCRCVPIPIDRFEWRALRAKGARIAFPYPDVPA